MPIEYQKWITRADLRANPDKVYVFGDNMLRVGLGGQAKEMRGEPNAIGVVTKVRPDMKEDSFFTDHPAHFGEVAADLAKVWAMLQLGKTVVVPADGIGTGLSQLPQRAPKLDAAIKQVWKKAEQEFPS
jgi:hypothetical protein